MGNKGSAAISQGPGRPPSKPFRKWERAMLKRTFEDLASRSSSGKTVDKDTFLRFFCNVPGMLGERLFFVFNSSRTGEIAYDEFCQGIALYCRGSLEQKIEFVFRMFNLKGDGRVGRGELETMLNSFVFAAESIISGRENEISHIGKAPSVKGSREGEGGEMDAGRVFNILQIDEEEAGQSDNEGNLLPILPPSSNVRSTFNQTQPIRRQSLPHATSLYWSTSQPSHLYSPNQRPIQPSTPPPGAQRSIPPPSPLTGGWPQPGTQGGGMGGVEVGGVAPGTDFTGDDSAKRIGDMVDRAMKIAMRGDGRVEPSTSLTSLPHTTPSKRHPTHPDDLSTPSSSTSSHSPPELTFYLFATWIQEFPEVLTVLDLAFAGSKEPGHAGGGSKDGGDVSSALDRLDSAGGGGHLLGSLITQLRGSSKAVRASPVLGPASRVHGRTFSITSLISPHVTAKEGMYGPSIGTDVMVGGKKDVLDLTCEACGWHVSIRHCYSCGKKVHLSTDPVIGGTVNGNGPSPSSTTTHPISSPPPLPAPSSSSPHTPHTPTSALTLVCSTCGVLFLSGHVRNCVQCGFDMVKSGQKIEPPLVKSLSWQRKQARGHSIEGFLMKVGKTLRSIVTRWYVIRDNFMYTYSKQSDVKPSHVLFLEGCFVEAVNHEERSKQCRWGLEIILNEEAHKSRFLYAASSNQRQQWIEAIRYHANVHSIEDYYDIREELGIGRFSSVRMGVSKQSGKQYAIKIIDKSDIDEREREALRTEVAVLKLLNHPNIIKCKNVFETRKQMFIVMTFVKGGDLFDRIVKRKRFTEAIAQKVMYQLLSVVSYLHLRGIVHNDLKPENVLCATEDDDSEIIIGDFGLSKFAMDAERFTMAQGTLAYVSPEVLKGTGYGKEVDLWSCGVILYLLVSGTLPFDSNEREVIVEKTMEGRVPFERKCFSEVSEECKNLIKGLLTVEVDRRFTCQQALNHPWFRLRWNERGERIANDGSLTGTQPSSALSSAPISPAMPSVGTSGAPQLVAAPHLFFTNSSTTTGEVDVDSSNEREEEEEEEEEEEDEEESESKDEAHTGGPPDAAVGGFRSRFLNIEDEEDGVTP